jgi:ABC-2 type transport system ATP-binding protein
MSSSIQVENFSKLYGEFRAVDDISFSVEEGSIFAFLGPNGAGKSTTINTLCTIQEKTRGTLRINGNDVTTEQAKVRKDIGIVFQECTLDSKLTVRENLKLHCDFYAVPKSEINDRIQFVLGLVDIEEWRNAPVSALSGGLKRRAEIARGLVHFPKVLFLDEPTTGLDPQTRANVWDYISKLQKQKNITIFLTTHYLEEAEICDQVAIIDHGKIVAHDTPYNLKKQHTRTTTRIKTSKTSDPDPLLRYCAERSLSVARDGEGDGEGLTITSSTSSDIGAVMELVSLFKGSIEDIEINKGKLDDVFISLTAKKIGN